MIQTIHEVCWTTSFLLMLGLPTALLKSCEPSADKSDGILKRFCRRTRSNSSCETSIIISPRAFQLVNLSLCNRKPQNHITTKILIQKQRSKPSFVGFGGVKLSHLQKHLRSQSPGSRKHSKQMCVRDLQQQMLHDSCCSGNHSAQLRKIAHSRKAKKQGWGVLLCFE